MKIGYDESSEQWIDFECLESYLKFQFAYQHVSDIIMDIYIITGEIKCQM